MSHQFLPMTPDGPTVFDVDVPDWWPGEGSCGNLLADLTPEQRDEYDAYQQLQANYMRRTRSIWLAEIGRLLAKRHGRLSPPF